MRKILVRDSIINCRVASDERNGQLEQNHEGVKRTPRSLQNSKFSHNNVHYLCLRYGRSVCHREDKVQASFQSPSCSKHQLSFRVEMSSHWYIGVVMIRFGTSPLIILGMARRWSRPWRNLSSLWNLERSSDWWDRCYWIIYTWLTWYFSYLGWSRIEDGSSKSRWRRP